MTGCDSIQMPNCCLETGLMLVSFIPYRLTQVLTAFCEDFNPWQKTKISGNYLYHSKRSAWDEKPNPLWIHINIFLLDESNPFLKYNLQAVSPCMSFTLPWDSQPYKPGIIIHSQWRYLAEYSAQIVYQAALRGGMSRGCRWGQGDHWLCVSCSHPPGSKEETRKVTENRRAEHGRKAAREEQMEQGRIERHEGQRHDRRIKSGRTGWTDGKKEGWMEGGWNIWKRKRGKDGKKNKSWTELRRM